MVELIQATDRRIIVRLPDGSLLVVRDDGIVMRNLPGRDVTEVKCFEYRDMLILNDALRLIYPDVWLPQTLKY